MEFLPLHIQNGEILALYFVDENGNIFLSNASRFELIKKSNFSIHIIQPIVDLLPIITLGKKIYRPFFSNQELIYVDNSNPTPEKLVKTTSFIYIKLNEVNTELYVSVLEIFSEIPKFNFKLVKCPDYDVYYYRIT